MVILLLCSGDVGHTAQSLLSVGREAGGCLFPSMGQHLIHTVPPALCHSQAQLPLIYCSDVSEVCLHCSGNSLLNGCHKVTRPTTSLGSLTPSLCQAEVKQGQSSITSPQPRHSVAPTKTVSLEIPTNV